MNMNDSKNVFNEFTNLYSLSKTLRFELKPYLGIPESEKEKLFGNEKEYYKNCKTYTEYHLKRTNKEYYKGKKVKNADLQLINFLHDQQIEDAYQILKPVFDKLHEEFITNSLENDGVKKIDFDDYYNLYKRQKDEQDKDEKKKIDKPLEAERNKLRKAFAPIYEAEGKSFKNKAGKDSKGKDILKESGFKVLTEAGILKYINNNIDELTEKKLKNKEGKEITKKNIKEAIGAENTEGIFDKFFTYFGGFNQNRENYYSTEEKSTAVASRIVDENLPKFCDNISAYKKNKNDYLRIFDFLKSKDKDLKLKNPKFDKENELEFIPAYDIKNDEKSFSIEDFVNCLSQDEIDKYNAKIANANYLINLYNQNKDGGSPKLSMLKILYKQIGCGEKKDFIDKIKDNNELKHILEKVAEAGKKYFASKDSENSEIFSIFDFINYIQHHETYKGIYWSDKALNTISSKYFANWDTLKNKLGEAKVLNKNTGEDKSDNKYKIPQAVMLSDLFTVLDDKIGKDEENEKWHEKGVFFKVSLFEGDKNKSEIIENADKPSQALLGMICDDIENLAKNFIDNSDEILKISENDYKKDKNKQKIKNWTDNALYIGQILKYWKVKTKFSVDSDFLNVIEKVNIFEVIENYDAIRNFLTQKPQNEINKLKLNFKNASLAGGWDENKIGNNYCTILKDKENKKYLAILAENNKKSFDLQIVENKGTNKIEKNNELYETENSDLQKMMYKQIAAPTGIGGFVRKCFNTAQVLGWNCPNDCLNSEGKIVIKNDEVKNLKKLTDVYKDFFDKYEKDGFKYKDYNFVFKDGDKYEKLNDFFTDVENQGYKIAWQNISKEILDKKVKKGEVYLFEIKNQDNNKNKSEDHRNNLHTIYWNALFEDHKNKPKLLGKAEIFYQPRVEKLDKKKVTPKNGKNKDKEIEIVDGWRFNREKFIFHCPLMLNYKEKNYPKPAYAVKEINGVINSEIKDINDIQFLGIDRGEKHLAYYSLVNQKGEILEQGSFNKINGQNYAEKLDKIANNRNEARKNWTTIGTIKELKDGYISQVIRKIVDLSIYKDTEKRELREMPAFIVLEDLNIGFKRGRQRIEKQVYQKLELALAKKLNFIVDKKAEKGEIGSVTRAIQLTPPVNNFGDLENRKQFGNMLYIRADYTSQTDPATGWRKTIYLKKGSEEYIKDQIIGNKEKKIEAAFDDIGFDGKDYYFSYTDKNTDKPWKLYSSKDGTSLDRYYRELVYKNSDKQWIPKKQNLVKMLDSLFDGFDKDESLMEQLGNKNPNKINEHTAWESLLFAINLIQQIRNTGENGDNRNEDFILSPVRDEKTKEHFDSRIHLDKEHNNEKAVLPTSGDANGAYNIARKGIIVAEHIKRGLNKLYISDEEWDMWLAGNEVWEKWLEINEKNLFRIKK